MTDEWSFQENISRGYLPTGEPLEALYGSGPWSREQEPDWPPITQCHICGGQAYNLGNRIDCENCGEIGLKDNMEDIEEDE